MQLSIEARSLAEAINILRKLRDQAIDDLDTPAAVISFLGSAALYLNSRFDAEILHYEKLHAH